MKKIIRPKVFDEDYYLKAYSDILCLGNSAAYSRSGKAGKGKNLASSALGLKNINKLFDLIFSPHCIEHSFDIVRYFNTVTKITIKANSKPLTSKMDVIPSSTLVFLTMTLFLIFFQACAIFP